MRGFGRLLGRVLLVVIAVAAALWVFGPYEEVDLKAKFEPRRFGEGVQVYFESIESRFDDITPGTEKRIVWAGQPETRTPVSLLYLHGFSATSEEIRPVPDRLAAALGANLVYTRLRGHGRNGDALGGVTANDWMQDVAEGLAAARHMGERVVVLSTSTGGTLAAAAALDPDLSEGVAAMVFISPNFRLGDPNAALLSFPAARHWVPLLVGALRSWEPQNAQQGVYWTTSYPTVALLPMAALVEVVAGMDFGQAAIPALFRFSDDDTVLDPAETHRVAADWGADSTVQLVTMGPGDDPNAHVIAGAIKSPGQTDRTVADILAWLKEQGIE